MVSRITSKGQITIPKKIRQKLNIQIGDKIEFLIDENGKIYISPIKSSLLKLKGILPAPNKVVSLDDMDKAIEQEASKL